MGRFPLRCLRRGIFAVALAVVAAGCHRQAPPTPVRREELPAAEHTLTVAFWNLNWFPGLHPHARPPAQAKHAAAVLPVAARLDADVLGLEEIAGRPAAETIIGPLRGFKVDVCSEFLRGPEAKRKRTRAAPREEDDNDPTNDDPPLPTTPDDSAPWTVPDQQQIALCSRLPVLATGAEPWKPDASGHRQRRGFVFAVYRCAPGEVLIVYGLHLKSNVADEPGGQPTNVLLREEAGRQLLVHARATAAAWARTDRLRLLIVGGDMNTSFDDASFEAETTLREWLRTGGLRWVWEGVPLPRRLTILAKGRYAAQCFDHVFYQPGNAPVKLVAATVESTGPAASDHHPIIARFAW